MQYIMNNRKHKNRIARKVIMSSIKFSTSSENILSLLQKAHLVDRRIFLMPEGRKNCFG